MERNWKALRCDGCGLAHDGRMKIKALNPINRTRIWRYILFNEVALVYRIRIDHTQKTFQLFRKCLLIFDIWYESDCLIVRMAEDSFRSQ